MPDYFELAQLLKDCGQSHILQGLEDLAPETKQAFLARIADIDWQELAQAYQPAEQAAPQAARVIDAAERQARQNELQAAGEAAYAQGKVAVLMVAGGMGTRLGLSGPKGCFEIGAHSGKSIYQIQAEKVLDCSRRFGHEIPFLIMTSPVTDQETRAYFAAHDAFSLAPGQLRFFSQGTVPSLDAEGRALLAEPGRLLENPDGHGGCFTALCRSGQLQQLAEAGIEYLVYIQVDNILVPVDDPILLGAAICEQADVVTKVLEKAHPDEKVGHLVRVGDHDEIIEYTELSPEQTRQLGPDGKPLYRWGSPAMHCWKLSFLQELADRGFVPPLHRSAKPLKAWDGQAISSVQGWKNERFIFDLIPQAAVSVGLAIDRREEFAPVKNAEGDDSPATARALLSACQASWLQALGVTVDLPEGALIEISPRFAGTAQRLAERWDGRVSEIKGDFYLED